LGNEILASCERKMARDSEAVEKKRLIVERPECEEGPYPSYVRELIDSRYPVEMLRAGIKANGTQWGPGGYVTIPELPSGLTNRVSLRSDITVESTAIRVLGVPGGFASPALLRSLADIADTYGEGHVHFTTAGTAQIYMPRSNIAQAVRALNDAGLDVGSTGDDVRSMSACPGTYRCDVALINAPAIADAVGSAVIDDQQFPGLPHKVKTGVSGCPNDCLRCQMQKDHAFVGVFAGAPQVDDAEFAEWQAKAKTGAACGSSGPVDKEYLLRRCPTGAIEEAGSSVVIDPDTCVHCMLCINKCPAIKPGEKRGVAWVLGGKYGHRGPNGAMLGFVMVPFIPAVGPDYEEIVELYQRFLDVYVENGKRKERIGDMIVRLGLRTVYDLMEIDPDPAVLIEPTHKSFIVHNMASQSAPSLREVE
jgi:sulfite reductase alpha subunit